MVGFTPRPFYSRGNSTRYPLDRRLIGTQSQSGRCGREKTLHPTGTRTPVASRYTDCAITGLRHAVWKRIFKEERGMNWTKVGSSRDNSVNSIMHFRFLGSGEWKCRDNLREKTQHQEDYKERVDDQLYPLQWCELDWFRFRYCCVESPKVSEWVSEWGSLQIKGMLLCSSLRWLLQTQHLIFLFDASKRMSGWKNVQIVSLFNFSSCCQP
jgi:hypothetical protein